MAHPNQQNQPYDLPPGNQAQAPFVINGEDALGAVQSGVFERVNPEGQSIVQIVGRGIRRWRQRGAGTPQRTISPLPAAVTYSQTDSELLRPLPLTVEPGTQEDIDWRLAVMHTLGQKQFEPHSLLSRLPHLTNSRISDMVSIMEARGIISHKSRYGSYEVLKTHGDTDEALTSVAFHLTSTRERFINNLIEQVNDTIQQRIIVHGDTAQTRQQAASDRAAAAQEIRNYAASVNSLRNSLNIPIPEVHRIINKLEHVGFLRVPVIDRGPDFEPKAGDPKWKAQYGRQARLAAYVYLTSEPDNMQEDLVNLFGVYQTKYADLLPRPNRDKPQPPIPAVPESNDGEELDEDKIYSIAINYLAGSNRKGKNNGEPFPVMSDLSFRNELAEHGIDTDIADALYSELQNKGYISKVHIPGVGFPILKSKDELRYILDQINKTET